MAETNTEVTPEEMRQIGDRATDINRAIQKRFNDLELELDSLRTDWVGRGGTSFQVVMTQYNDAQRKIDNALHETALALGISAQEYAKADVQSADLINVTKPMPL